MAVLKNKWLFFIINLGLTTLLFFILAPVYNLFHYIDVLFYLSLFYLLFGLLMWVIRGGFFDSMTYGFRAVVNRFTKNTDYMESWKEKSLPSQKINKSVVRVFLFQGALLTVVMTLLLFFYYA
ncbi:DUF3899 domain-containing protein [Thalassobacillus sp. B23F22_16]|uniref:DUF3899 domain-containing protein n=1 Tax=Thalassobacillus sp. B23F22_16 TaxID=3459513 RepID=UPI00373EE68E